MTKCKLDGILGSKQYFRFSFFFAFLVLWSFLFIYSIIWFSIYLILWIQFYLWNRGLEISRFGRPPPPKKKEFLVIVNANP